MKKKRWLAVILACAMCAGLLAGCSSSSDSSSETTAAESAAETTGETEAASESEGTAAEGETASSSDNVLRYQVSTLVDSMDPALSNDATSCGVISQCMMGLMTKDADGNVVLGVAEDETISEDGLTITFTIREDAYWSNGDPVTAQDFVYAWRRVADPATGSDYQFFIQTACILNADDIVSGEMSTEELGVEATDDKTLVVTLSTPCAIFDSLMTSSCFLPLNESFVESCGDDFATSADTLLSNGPFTVTSYEPSAMTIKLEKSETFFDADQVSLDGVEFYVITDTQTAALSFESGELDVVTLSGSQVEQYEDDERYSTRSDGYSWYLTTNLENEELANLNIRLALAKSIDKESLTSLVLKDGSTPMDYVIPSGLSTGPTGNDFREDAGDSYDNWTYDVETAQEYWQAGLEELGVTSLSFTLMCEDTDSAQSVAQYLQSEWQTNLSGLTIELKVVPKKARLEYMQEGDYDIGLTRWGPDYADPITDLDIWVTDSSTNYSNWSNEEYDSIIESAKYGELALDSEARWEALIECEQMLADDCVLIPLYGQSSATMTSSSVSGIQYYTVGIPYLFINATKN